MSYTDYLRRKLFNTPQVIDTQMRLPDASSFTWRKKLASTVIDTRTHAINNVFDPSSTPYLRRQVQSFASSGFGGRVPDASSYTMGRGARSLGQDNFSGGKIVTNTLSAAGGCLTRPPPSQVVDETGNAEGSAAGLNMGYVTTCSDGFYPLTKSHFVDTIPQLKTRKIGTQSRDPGDGAGRQIVQNAVTCTSTDTIVAKSNIVDVNGINLAEPKTGPPFNSYSPVPNNVVGSPRYLVHSAFITSRTGPQTGGGNTPGSRAAIVGGVSVKPKGTITHRGQATTTRAPYPHRFVPPSGSPAHLRLNGPVFGTRAPRI